MHGGCTDASVGAWAGSTWARLWQYDSISRLQMPGLNIDVSGSSATGRNGAGIRESLNEHARGREWPDTRGRFVRLRKSVPLPKKPLAGNLVPFEWRSQDGLHR